MEIKKPNFTLRSYASWHLQLRYRNHMAQDLSWNGDVQEIARSIGTASKARNYIAVAFHLQGQEAIFRDRWWWVLYLCGAVLVCAGEGWENDKNYFFDADHVMLRKERIATKRSDLLPWRCIRKHHPESLPMSSKCYLRIILIYYR